MMKFKDDLDEKHEDLFAKAIWPCSSLSEKILEYINLDVNIYLILLGTL